MPTVSLFMPTHARFDSGHLHAAIESALGQTFEDFELLVVDDGSIDGTAQYLQEVAERDPRVRVTRLERNSGLPAYALAQAYPLASGRIFAWLFDDCVLEPQHLARLVETLDADPEADMAYAKVRARLADGDDFVIGAPLDVAALETGANMIPNVCVALKRTVIETVGWYDHHVVLKRLCDWDLWLRIARSHRILFIDEVLASEHGVGLPLSLGRLHQALPVLALRYASLDRNHRLAPGDLEYTQAFEIPEALDLDAVERAGLNLACFEHAMLTANHALARRLASRLREEGAIESALARYAARNGRAAASGTTLLVTTMDLFRRRLAEAAQDQIDMEIQMRRALAVADDRFAYIRAQEDEIRARDEQIVALAARLDAQAEQQQQVSEQEQEAMRAAEARILALDDALQVSLRMQEATRRELADTFHALLIHRDAADQRMSMLHAAHARITDLEAAAQRRQEEETKGSQPSRTDALESSEEPSTDDTVHPEGADDAPVPGTSVADGDADIPESREELDSSKPLTGVEAVEAETDALVESLPTTSDERDVSGAETFVDATDGEPHVEAEATQQSVGSHPPDESVSRT